MGLLRTTFSLPKSRACSNRLLVTCHLKTPSLMQHTYVFPPLSAVLFDCRRAVSAVMSAGGAWRRSAKPASTLLLPWFWRRRQSCTGG